MENRDVASITPERSLWMAEDPDQVSGSIAGVRFTSSKLAEIPPHHHAKGQLLHVLNGVVVMKVRGVNFTLPPGRAIWLPPGDAHSARYPQTSEMLSVFLDTRAIDWNAPRTVRIYRLDPLAAALLTEAASMNWSADPSRVEVMTLDLLLARLDELQGCGVALPEGNDPRLRRAMTWLAENPSAPDDLDLLARQVWCSRRTLYRLFQGETGMTPAVWRRQMRMGLALERLATGMPVGRIAEELGYSNPANFSVAFKANFGTTPSAFFA